MLRSKTIGSFCGLCMVLSIVSGCVLGPPFKAYPGPERNETELAVVIPDNRFAASDLEWISQQDGTTLYSDSMVCPWALYRYGCAKDEPFLPQKILLLPGKYTFQYSMCKNTNKVPISHVDSVDLEAGHVYKVIGKLCWTVYCAAWIEDSTTHQVVSGNQYCD